MEHDQIECCPHCRSEEGYFVKTQIRGKCESRYKFDGQFDEDHNSDMHDGLSYKDGRYAYCRSCRKRLFQLND